jgi:hypothetical protein
MALMEKVKMQDLKIARLSTMMEKALNQEHHKDGQREKENVVYKKENEFIQVE